MPKSLKSVSAGQPREIKQRYSAWEIAGIQHEIFLRVLPGLRHELVGPISVSRMGISVLKRTLEKGEADKDSLQQQVLRMDEQMQQSVLGIRALRLWDADSNITATAAHIISHGLKLMSYRLSLRNITIDYLMEDDVENTESESTPAGKQDDAGKQIYQPFLYTWLGVLGYFEDHFNEAVTLKIAFVSSNALSVNFVPGSTESVSLLQTEIIEANRHHIDQHALVGLAQHYDNSIAFAKDALTLTWQ